MNARFRKIAMWVGYPVFYFGCLMVFAYVSAPWGRLKEAVTTGFNAASPLRMEMEDLSWSWRFPGVAASGVRLVGAEPGPDPTGKPRPAPEYQVDDFYARVSVLPLLWGTSKLGFALDGFGGSIDGTVKTASDERRVDLDLSKVDAAKMPYLADVIGIPIAGTVGGEIDLTLPEQKLSKAEGKVELGISGFEIGDGKTKIRDTIALPKVQAGEFSLKAEVAEGIVKITEFTTKGADLEVVAEGRIRLMDRMDTSLVELNVRYKFSDAYRNKDETTRGLFGAPGSTVPGLFDLDPKMKRAKRDDGFYAWRVAGPLSHLTFNPGAGSTTAADTASARKRPTLRTGSKPRTPPASAPPAAPAGFPPVVVPPQLAEEPAAQPEAPEPAPAPPLPVAPPQMVPPPVPTPAPEAPAQVAPAPAEQPEGE